MGRPINADAAKTRSTLLSVAIEHFGRDGFQGATTRGIAQGVGVSFATVHHYFGTKEALFAECIKCAFDDLMSLGMQVVLELTALPHGTRVERSVRRCFRLISQRPSRARFLLRAFVFEDPELVAAHVPPHREKLVAGARKLLQGRGAGDSSATERVRLMGISMLMTRFAAASRFERDILGDAAFAEDGIIEDYLVEIAMATIGPDLASLSQLSELIRP